MSSINLIPIRPDSDLPAGLLPEGDHSPTFEMARSILQMTLTMYEHAGFTEPWGGYLATIDSSLVGTCGFKGKPQDGSVEIAYFTFPDFEGQGVATKMAQGLVDIAAEANPDVLVTAQTLVDRDASHRILEKLGFTSGETIQHPEDGSVIEWRHGN